MVVDLTETQQLQIEYGMIQLNLIRFVLFQWFLKKMNLWNPIWATSWENLPYAICEQQRGRSTCAHVQSDKRLFCSLHIKYDICTYKCYTQHVKTLASLCSWAGRFEFYLFANLQRQVFSWYGSFCLLDMLTELIILETAPIQIFSWNGLRHV